MLGMKCALNCLVLAATSHHLCSLTFLKYFFLKQRRRILNQLVEKQVPKNVLVSYNHLQNI